MKNFRGNILDRQFPVQFDPSSGQYSYNYADVTPNISSKLKNLKYYRKSSKDLTEIEADLAAFLKKEGPAAPPVKGNITKAAEGEVAKYAEVANIFQPLREKQLRGEVLTANEKSLFGKATSNITRQLRSKKADQARALLKEIQEKANEKGLNINAIRKKTPFNDFTANETSFQNTELAKLVDMEQLILAYERLEGFQKKETEGQELTPDELTQKQEAERLLNTKKISNLGAALEPLATTEKKRNEKYDYNNARAKITQIEGTPVNKRTVIQLKNLMNAKAIVTTYEASHPNARSKKEEKEESMEKGMAEKTYRNSKQKLNTLSKKAKPLTAENTAEEIQLQAVVNAYRASNPNANAENVEVGNFFNANRPAAAPMNKPKAVTGGRRTRKAKKSKRKTYRRKH